MAETYATSQCNPQKELAGRLHRLRNALAPVEARFVRQLEHASTRLQLIALFRHAAGAIEDAFAEAADPEMNVTTFSRNDPPAESPGGDGAHPSTPPGSTAAASDRPGL